MNVGIDEHMNESSVICDICEWSQIGGLDMAGIPETGVRVAGVAKKFHPPPERDGLLDTKRGQVCYPNLGSDVVAGKGAALDLFRKRRLKPQVLVMRLWGLRNTTS
ncbi:hypothetical protein AG1IA_01928 [Rhizoctonia solani AG-1 IA]|uniref:Uncharacterized protein n=1 Tax=Thanatephorus cucumeris (strain AG1-IA) TaxID=983506 RepID=L8X124_THACA|nr:hypothetical protein AG1IA_01928 [Rhizoctonia solani AG-1 IA]